MKKINSSPTVTFKPKYSGVMRKVGPLTKSEPAPRPPQKVKKFGPDPKNFRVG